MSFVRVLPVVVRRLLVRRPWIYWVVILAAAAGAMVSVRDRVSAVDSARRSWGETRSVLIASADVAPGEQIVVTTREVPVAMIPAGALEAERAAGPLQSRQHVSSGEIVTAVDVVPADVAGPLALVPPGWVALPIVESPRSGAAIGTRVQLAGGGMLLAPDALVVGAHDDVTLVAVPADVAPMIPAAATSDGVTVLLVP